MVAKPGAIRLRMLANTFYIKERKIKNIKRDKDNYRFVYIPIS